jgi:16S rRNA (cytidine1402-2'-O)-methyltransferase
MSAGTLYLVTTPLDFGCEPQGPLDEVMPAGTLALACGLACWISENARSTRAFLKRVAQTHPLVQPIQELQIQELPRQLHKQGDHDGRFDARPLLQPALAGQDMGLVCEAGMPAIADPGSSVVRSAHALHIKVVPLSGPMSLMLALAASGLNGQNFAFVGYLPQDAGERAQRLRSLEALAHKSGQTQLFIETPYRNAALMNALLQTLQASTRLAVGCGLTLPQGFSLTLTVQDWKKRSPPQLDAPTVFAIGR